MDINSKIRSPYTGRVVELKVNAGKIIGSGAVILSIERTFSNEELESMLKESGLVELNQKDI